MLARIVLDDDARHGPEQRAGAVGVDRARGFNVDGFRMADEHGNADGRARQAQVREVEDLAALGHDLPLFLRGAIRHEDIDFRDRVEGDRMRVDRRRKRFPGDVGAHLPLELDQRVGPGPGDRLIGVDDHPLEADGIPERHEDRRELHGRTVRVGDDAFMPGEVLGVDLADNEWNGRIHAPRRRIVDDRRAARSGLRGKYG